MLINNSKKIVVKLGSSTVVDNKGKFKKKWVKSLIKDIKKFREKKDLVIVRLLHKYLLLLIERNYQKLQQLYLFL